MTKKIMLMLTILLAIGCGCANTFAQNKTNKKNRLLIVVSGYGKDSGMTRPGYEFDEFSQAYLIFKNNGFVMEVASPKGGAVEPDEFNHTKPYNKSVVEDKGAMAMLAATKPTAELVATDYDAVYIVGGKGAMFDLPYDPALQDFLAAIHERQGAFIAAVCHGPAAMAHIKNKAGGFLVQDQRMTGFSNEEEKMFGKKWGKEFPFMLEDKLQERKAVYERAPVMLPHVIVSGKIITGQNPYSTTALAEALVAAMGKKPVTRKWYADEYSMQLVKRVLSGEESWARTELAAAKDNYYIELIAVYGYYQLIDKDATDNDVQEGLLITELARPYMFNEMLWYEMAKGYIRMGARKKAKDLVDEILAKKPDFKQAKELQATLQ